MKLTARAPCHADFGEFYGNLFRTNEHNQALRSQVQHEWNVFQRNETTLSLMIEDEERPPSQRMVGFLQSVFVSDRYVQYVKSCKYPRANWLASRSLPDKSWPLLNREQVAAANAGSGLNALVTRWGRANALLGAADLQSIQRFGCHAFLSLTRAYQFREILMEAIGDDACLRGKYAGFEVRCDFADLERSSDRGWTSHNHPYLMGATAQEAAAHETSLISQFFLYTPPRLHFKADHCRLLRAALQGANEEEMAVMVGRTAATVKKWWLDIYAQADGLDADLLSPDEETDAMLRNRKSGKRGPEKRRKLLKYLHEHPEELGPG